ncbi:hypothetical protein JD844_018884 [Phrynosoma platyrhinos]|uniref:Breast carcinoma-amplified sequence 4 n=1 Tax=Phrynosoma platyrhinos TaxID=52577 RepID=A0ABQ7SPD4_PHRPL|nr:hypothetical protein JD844_018884 [Phrynosoma platyrhinos]
MSNVANTERKPFASSRGFPPSSSSSSFSSDRDWEEKEACKGQTLKMAGEGEDKEKTEAQWLTLSLVPEAEEVGRRRDVKEYLEDRVKEVEEHIEEMLIKLDEFCSITDMIRTDTSQLQDDMIPLIKAKVIEMNNIYTKVDKLEAFVKMVAYHVSFLEEQVIQAERAHAIFPSAVRKLLGSVAIPSFKKRKGLDTIRRKTSDEYTIDSTDLAIQGDTQHDEQNHET